VRFKGCPEKVVFFNGDPGTQNSFKERRNNKVTEYWIIHALFLDVSHSYEGLM
jgi:hypothetical protein